MNLISKRLCLLLAAMLLYPVASSAQAVSAMKLLTPTTGWVQSNLYHLYWTTDEGAHWKEITPPKSPQEFLTGVFFLDSSSGWAVLVHGDDQELAQFRVASTRDAGASWSVSPIRFPGKRMADDYAGGANVFFLDQLHGWIKVDRKSSSAFAIGDLLVSDDGGKTWKFPLGDSGEAGYLCFFSLNDGLLAGGVDSSELWATHDGSKTWQQLSLKAPTAIAPAEFPTFGRPQCGPGKTGFLPVTYSGPDSAKSALVLLSSDDAGRTWKPSVTLSQLDETSQGQMVSSAVCGSSLIAATRSSGEVTLTVLSPASDMKRIVLNSFKEIPDLSFADLSHGWASTHSGLLATSDGGVSWTVITPAKTGPLP
ncbi:MAG: hypothetical protein HY010_22445 [Acidobacteria bacterium]|nr:hypothetical protein [Acidobacteriota bacterium]